jgi:glycosyltransferase involved in cell wall biosynthesis
LEGRQVILTFGLINPNKGVEYGIKAVARLVDQFPSIAYVILGATHPEIKRRYGESYRLSLERLVKSKGLHDHVLFYNRYVSLEQWVQFLIMSDLYVTPYVSHGQIVSSTLAYAIACGKATISTPYWYTQEMLADGRGVLIPFRDPEALAGQIAWLLTNPVERDRLWKRAYDFGRQLVWEKVGSAYMTAFERVR